MIIDFKQQQYKVFDDLARCLQAAPETYLDFESVSDFYKAEWLNLLPKGATWFCTGLDDGGAEFDILIRYGNRRLYIYMGEKIKMSYRVDD